MNKYESTVRNQHARLRDIPPCYREKYICGYIAAVLDSTSSPRIKLSKISAAIEALERVGRE